MVTIEALNVIIQFGLLLVGTAGVLMTIITLCFTIYFYHKRK